MSRDRYRKNKPNDHLNCVVEERLSARDKAIRNLKHCKDREKAHETKLIIVDKKTYIIRELGEKVITPKKRKTA